MSKRPTKQWLDRLTVILGSLILLFVALGSWVPRDCPLIRNWIVGCPSAHVVTPQTEDQRELARIAHQDIPGNVAQFSVRSQDFRGTTQVNFLYRADYTKHVAYLIIHKAAGKTPLALITHPLLYNLDWSRVSTAEPPVSLYQRSGQTYQSVDQIKAQLPAKGQVAVDSVIAKQWKLQANQYTDLDALTSLDGIQYVITSYAPPGHDGSWLQYDQTFDVQDALVDKDGLLQWEVYVPIVQNPSQPFRLAPVHINYKRMQP